MDNLHIKIEGEQKEVVIREGTALELKPPNKIIFFGRIDSIQNWLNKRVDTIEQKKCVILVDYDKLYFELRTNEKEFYNTVISGKLELSKEFIAFGINSDKKWESHKLADFIKMNRLFFESKDEAMSLVTTLKQFKATVNKAIEKTKDDRANYDEKRSQIVQSNLPENFKVKIPVFKGMEAFTLELEIYIDPVNLDCSLVSPEANDFINEQSKSLIDDQIKAIEVLAPDIAIIYQ